MRTGVEKHWCNAALWSKCFNYCRDCLVTTLLTDIKQFEHIYCKCVLQLNYTFYLLKLLRCNSCVLVTLCQTEMKCYFTFPVWQLKVIESTEDQSTVFWLLKGVETETGCLGGETILDTIRLNLNENLTGLSTMEMWLIQETLPVARGEDSSTFCPSTIRIQFSSAFRSHDENLWMENYRIIKISRGESSWTALYLLLNLSLFINVFVLK